MAVAPLLGDGIVMRILFVVHRYGIEVRGGAEGACRELATRLAARGHDVTVLTTRALGYRTWEPHYASGEEVLDGVRVVRLENRVRDVEAFDRLHLRIERADDPIATPLQAAWIEAQGPVVPDLPGWFADHAPELGHTAMDLRMLVLFGSAERTREEFTDLAGRAGLKITDTRTAGLGLSLITCTLAGTAG